MKAKFVFDIGGTHTRAGISGPEGDTVDKIVERETPQDPKAGVALLGALAKEIGIGSEIVSAAGGIAGVFNKEKTKLLKSPNLPAWAGGDLKMMIGQTLGCPVSLANDTIAAGIGEALFGAGKGKVIVAYITVSTGVGGAKIENGKPDLFNIGFEPGHQIIVTGSDHVPVYLGDLISGKSFIKRWGDNFIKTAPSEAWEEAAKYLAVGLNNTIVHWSPDVIVLGGSMITKPPGISLGKVTDYLRNIMEIFPEIPPIVTPALGEYSALYGAIHL